MFNKNIVVISLEQIDNLQFDISIFKRYFYR